jgi:iron complex outermembrane recepter protein
MIRRRKMSFHAKRIAALILLFGIATTANQPVSAKTAIENVLSGTVADEENEPLAGATIWIPELERGTTSDPAGQFAMRNLPDGEWTFTVRHVGFQTQQLTIRIPDQYERHIAVTLKADVIMSEELLVIGRLFERITRYQPTQTFRADQIQQRNTSSIGNLLDGESGVAMRSMGNAPARPVVRGMDGERIQILQNGMRMGDFSSTGHDHAVIMEPLSIDRVDIIRGPASLIYGSSAMGGIVNVHSADIPSGWTTGSSGYLGTEGQSGMESLTAIARMTYGTESSAYTFRSSLRNTGNLKTPAGEVPGTDLRSMHLATGASWRSSNGFSGGSVQFSGKTYGIPEDPFDQDEEIVVTMQRLAVQGLTHRRLNHRFWEAAELRMVYNYYTQEEIEYEYVDGVLDDEDLELSIDHHMLQGDLLFQHGRSGVLDNGTLGLTFSYRDVAIGGEEALTPDARGGTLAGFVVEEMRLPGNWRLQTGIRLEWNRIKSIANADFPDAGKTRNKGIWAGSIGISGPLNTNLRGGLQLSRAHRTPSLEELFADAIHFAAGAYEVGDPSLKDEIGIGTDLFMDYKKGPLELHFALFANRISNYITMRPTGRTEPLRNYPILEYYGSDARLFGGEFSAGWQISRNWNLSLMADYIHGSELRDGSREPLPFMPPLRARVQTGYDTGTWWANAQVRHVLKQNRTSTEEEVTSGYTLTEAGTGVRLGSNRLHHVTLAAENIFDVTWRDHLSRIEQRDIPMMGRNIRLSYRLYF